MSSEPHLSPAQVSGSNYILFPLSDQVRSITRIWGRGQYMGFWGFFHQ